MGAIDSYLGCPNIDQCWPKQDFARTKSKITQQLDSQKARTLSTAGKVTFIKSDPTGILQCAMNWLKFPKYIFNEIDKIN